MGLIRALNVSLITKWWWRLMTEPDSLWARALKGIHNLKIITSYCISKKAITGVWNNVENVQEDLKDFGIDIENVLVKRVERGDDTLFWLDRWIGNLSLKISFPELYQMDKKKRCKVLERVQIRGPT